jgi:hypothetical protein
MASLHEFESHMSSSLQVLCRASAGVVSFHWTNTSLMVH